MKIAELLLEYAKKSAGGWIVNGIMYEVSTTHLDFLKTHSQLLFKRPVPDIPADKLEYKLEQDAKRRDMVKVVYPNSSHNPILSISGTSDALKKAFPVLQKLIVDLEIDYHDLTIDLERDNTTYMLDIPNDYRYIKKVMVESVDQFKTVYVKVKPGLTQEDGIAAVWRAAKRKGKIDCRGISYDPSTGKGQAT